MMWNIYKPETEEDIDLLESVEIEKKLILHNDDYNTFDWVIETLVELCDHSTEQAEQCAFIVHFKGKCQVKHGPESHIRNIHELFNHRGLTSSVE